MACRKAVLLACNTLYATASLNMTPNTRAGPWGVPAGDGACRPSRCKMHEAQLPPWPKLGHEGASAAADTPTVPHATACDCCTHACNQLFTNGSSGQYQAALGGSDGRTVAIARSTSNPHASRTTSRASRAQFQAPAQIAASNNIFAMPLATMAA